jgi:hypothetical protein
LLTGACKFVRELRMNNRRHLLLLCYCQTSPSQDTTPRSKFSRELGFWWWKLAWQLGRLLGTTFHVRDPCKQTRMETDFVKEWCQNEICSMWRISSVGTTPLRALFGFLPVEGVASLLLAWGSCCLRYTPRIMERK